jgi:RecF/RecN/SMC N terminal domain
MIRWLEICGFRAFTTPQRLEFASRLALISGPNSQGKTSIAEAVEFLLCGETLRRALLGGAKAEFEASLRNAHLDPAAPVWVKAGVVADDGAVHEVTRTLTRDYGADGECDSELLIDDQPAVDLSGLGVVLADPPLRTPILFQHTIRFALSSRPQDRADYFRAVLEVADLELIRDELIALRSRVQPPAVASLQRLDRCAEVPTLASVCQKIRSASSPDVIKSALAEGAQVGATELGADGYDPEQPLALCVEALAAATRAHGERAFPAAQFEVAGSLLNVAGADLNAVGAYSDTAVGVDVELQRMRRLFEATLELPHVAAAHEPIDCPVCESRAALTPTRIERMRTELAGAAALRRDQTRALAELDQLLVTLDQIDPVIPAALPTAGRLDADGYRERETQAGELIADGLMQLRALRGPLVELSGHCDSVTALVSQARQALDTLREAVARDEGVDPASARAALAGLADQIGQLNGARAAYRTLADPILAQIRSAAEERQQVGGWSEFVELARDLSPLITAVRSRRAQALVSARLELAIADVEKANMAVYDAKFEGMSSEIAVWWQLLRPDEPAQFDRVARRGSGRRFVSFKALLRPAAGAAGVERDALGVFSDSQLNALGLAAFLARCSLQGSPLLLLDDPVQAGDDEHRATFVAGVIQALLERGTQVIVVSHDDMLSKLMHHRYDYLPLSGFAITLATPGEGARVVATSDTAQALLERTGAYLGHPDPEFRKVGAGKLRDAAERVAKEILVRKRTEAGESASVADYEGQTLGPLIAALEPYLDDPSHRGKWRNVNDLLSPGSHDGDPPAATALGVARGDLKQFHSHYLSAAAGGS